MANISASEKLRHCVKGVIYDHVVLEDIDRTEWELCLRVPLTTPLPAEIADLKKDDDELVCSAYRKAFDLWESKINIASLCTAEALEAGWQQYTKMMENSAALRATRVDYESIASSFAGLSELKWVEVMSDCRSILL